MEGSPDEHKLFLGSLSWETNEDGIRGYFSRFGEVVDAVVKTDSNTGRPRGFGFVLFRDSAAMTRALEGKPHTLDARQIDVQMATSRQPKGPPSHAQHDSRPAQSHEHHQPPAHQSQQHQGAPYQSNTSRYGGPPPPAEIQEPLADTCKVFVGGVSQHTTVEKFRAFFEDRFGRVRDAMLMRDRDTGRQRGFGFVMFETVEQAHRVVREHGNKRDLQLDGKSFEVKMAQPEGSSALAKPMSGPPPRRGGGAGSSYPRDHPPRDRSDRGDRDSYRDRRDYGSSRSGYRGGDGAEGGRAAGGGSWSGGGAAYERERDYAYSGGGGGGGTGAGAYYPPSAPADPAAGPATYRFNASATLDSASPVQPPPHIPVSVATYAPLTPQQQHLLSQVAAAATPGAPLPSSSSVGGNSGYYDYRDAPNAPPQAQQHQAPPPPQQHHHIHQQPPHSQSQAQYNPAAPTHHHHQPQQQQQQQHQQHQQQQQQYRPPPQVSHHQQHQHHQQQPQQYHGHYPPSSYAP